MYVTMSNVVEPFRFAPEKLVAARKRKLWSRYQLAAAAKVHEGTLRKIELGKTVRPSERIMSKLLAALGIDNAEVYVSTSPDHIAEPKSKYRLGNSTVEGLVDELVELGQVDQQKVEQIA